MKTSWILTAVTVVVSITVIAGIWFGSAVDGLVCGLLSVLTVFGLWCLYATPSAANEIDLREGVLGFFILIIGLAAGSSPPIYPKLAGVWEAAHLPNQALVRAPDEKFWKVTGRHIEPTLNLPKDLCLVVTLPSDPEQNLVIDAEGFNVPKEFAKVRMHLQNRFTDRTSSSLSLSLEAKEKKK
ncbi:hypothetical protein FJZ27_05010 [Candidatus Peribacteria bacterium]|nr:hypothetical protein [Candidatus Peribacteria bacterium]